MVSRSSPKLPISKRSASSSTSVDTFLKKGGSAPWMCAARRPGVATTMCGRFCSSNACVTESTPPITVAIRRPMGPPKAANCSLTCKASSRVGVSTTPKMP
eukprot:scaffold1748_cov258-Pinguiococcus_pyrenoidosus.AAC.11